MTQIAEYFAEAGVLIDKKSISNVRKYLNGIQKQFQNFETKLAKGSAKGGQRVNPYWQGIQKQFTAKPFKISVSVDQRSLALARTQIRASLQGAASNINVRVTPSVSRPRVPAQSPGGGRSSSGGGGSSLLSRLSHTGGGLIGYGMSGMGLGAVARFGGPAALAIAPAALGVYGANALSNSAARFQATQSQLLVGAQDPELAKQQFQYLRNVGNQYGYTSQALAPSYARMFQGVRGNQQLESGLARGFESVVQYSAVNSLSQPEIERVLRALSQSVSKGKFMAEEVRGQLGDVLPAAEQMLARAVGVDREQLVKMMENGQLSVDKYMIPFLEQFRKEAAPALPTFMKSIQAGIGRRQAAQSEFMMALTGGEAGSALTMFQNVLGQNLREAIPLAESLNKIIANAVNGLSKMILAPSEFIRWFNGETNDKNMFQKLFGDASENEQLLIIFNNIKGIFTELVSLGGMFFESLINVGKIAAPVVLELMEKATAMIRQDLQDIRAILEFFKSIDFITPMLNKLNAKKPASAPTTYGSEIPGPYVGFKPPGLPENTYDWKGIDLDKNFMELRKGRIPVSPFSKSAAGRFLQQVGKGDEPMFPSRGVGDKLEVVVSHRWEGPLRHEGKLDVIPDEVNVSNIWDAKFDEKLRQQLGFGNAMVIQ